MFFCSNEKISLLTSRRKRKHILLRVLSIVISDPAMLFSLFANVFIVVKRHLSTRLSGRKWIVVSLTEHIGDVVAAEPVGRYLREQFPDAYIMWVVDRKYKALVGANPVINCAVTVTCFSEWVLLQYIVPAKNLFDLHLHEKVCDKHQLQLRKKTNNSITDTNYYRHGNLLHAFSHSGGLSIDDTTAPKLYLKLNTISPFPSPYVVIHTSSNNPKRTLSENEWTKLGNYLLQYTPDLVLVEVGSTQKIRLSSQRYRCCCGFKELSFIASQINQAVLFIGIDSGFAHFANALQKESFIVIGQYNGFINYMPYSGKFQQERDKQLFYASEEVASLCFETIEPALRRKLQEMKSSFEHQQKEAL